MSGGAGDLIRQVRQFLETEKALGAVDLPRPAPVPEMTPDQKRAALEELGREAAECRSCALCQTRTHVVFGTGSPAARLMFVGEAPGQDEDLKGEPFVGAAGQLLTKIIEAMKLRREDVYIANCLKCRPPQNRNPLPTEIVTCRPFLERQIRIIRPRVICTLGKFATQTLLETEEPISRLRGRFFDRGDYKILPTFHPAYLLRNPSDKRLVWEDVQKIMRELSS